MPTPIGRNVVTIRVPSVHPITTGGPLSFSGVLKIEKAIDGWYSANSLARFEVPRSKVPAKMLKPGFETAKTYKIPLKAIFGSKEKGSVYATRLQNTPDQDHFAVYSEAGKRLAVRQKSGDYAPGFFWSNYQVR